jgi:allantoin racemase
MTKIKVIIPNSGMAKATLEDREKMLSRAVSSNTVISVNCIDRGPLSVESVIDEVLVAPEIIRRTVNAEDDGHDAVVIYCFSDPGLTAAREAVHIPVVGPGETSMAVACMLGHQISVITTLTGGISRVRMKLKQSGFDMNRLSSVRGLDIPVVNLRENAQLTIDRITEVVEIAVAQDGAEVIVMGCLGLAGYGDEAESRFNVPVIDPSFLAVSTAEMFAKLGIRHSGRTYFHRSMTDVLRR